jgi:hypothetical protein
MAAPLFSTPPYISLAAHFGDRPRALQLFRRAQQSFALPPFGISTEYASVPNEACNHPDCVGRPRTYGSYLTNWGQLMQAAMVGMTGLRTSSSDEPADWIRYAAALPEGWDSVELQQVYISGKRCSVLARHGSNATLNCTAGTTQERKYV